MDPGIEQRLADLEERLGVTFADRRLLLRAVTHRSFLNERHQHPDVPVTEHNEILEFLGDAVLEIIVTEHLVRCFSDEGEGQLTAWRAALVNAETLARVGDFLRLEDILFLSRGEREDKGKARKYILANAVEAIIGATYLDQGIGVCRLLVDATLLSFLPDVVAASKDLKGQLQELAQQRFKITPRYEVVREWGLDHDRRFVVAVVLSGERVAEAEGASKNEAEKGAAEVALATIATWEGRLLERGRSVSFAPLSVTHEHRRSEDHGNDARS